MFRTSIGRWLSAKPKSHRRRETNSRAKSGRFRLETLEGRDVPAVITVTGTGDTIAADGFVTLREALTAANTNAASGDAQAGEAGFDVIYFNIAGLPGTVHTIQPMSALPTITDPVFINGYSQFGGSPNTQAQGNNAFLAVELDGSQAGFTAGLTISAGGSTVQGLVINRFLNEGILILGGGGNTIRGNFLGTDATGTLARGNGVSGVSVFSSDNLIGGMDPPDRNVISGNSFSGISVVGGSVTGNLIRGNLIGTDRTGIAALANGGAGVRIFNVTGNTIGGLTEGAGNTIAFNNGPGILVSNASGHGNAILRNNIFGNAGAAIDLASDGLTPNDPLDADDGPNGLQNFPDIATAITFTDNTTIRGTLNSTPNSSLRIEFFRSAGADPSGYGPAQEYIGFTMVNTDAQGLGTFTFVTTFPGAVGQVVTATATDANNNTSELSAAVAVTDSVPLFATGAGVGGDSLVNVFNADGSTRFSFVAYPGFTGGVRVATGDVTGDGVDDIVTGAAAGGGPHVKVYDGVTGAVIASFFAFDPNFGGGVSVGVSDVNGDGKGDVLVGAGPGGGPHVVAIDANQLGNLQGDGQIADNALLRNFFAYHSDFRGGVAVAGGDMNDDGVGDIVTGAGMGGGPHVEVFNGADGSLLANFYAFDPTFTGGVSVGASDVDGDGLDDVLVGAGVGGGSQVIAVDGGQLGNVQAKGQIAGGAILRNFAAYGANFAGPVLVAGASFSDDAVGDIITGAGPGGGPHVKISSGANDVLLADFFAQDPAFAGGVYVG